MELKTTKGREGQWYKRGLFFNSAFTMISIGTYFKAFGILLQKNGNSLDFKINLFFIYLHISFWDKFWWRFKWHKNYNYYQFTKLDADVQRNLIIQSSPNLNSWKTIMELYHKIESK